MRACGVRGLVHLVFKHNEQTDTPISFRVDSVRSSSGSTSSAPNSSDSRPEVPASHTGPQWNSQPAAANSVRTLFRATSFPAAQRKSVGRCGRFRNTGPIPAPGQMLAGRTGTKRFTHDQNASLSTAGSDRTSGNGCPSLKVNEGNHVRSSRHVCPQPSHLKPGRWIRQSPNTVESELRGSGRSEYTALAEVVGSLLVMIQIITRSGQNCQTRAH